MSLIITIWRLVMKIKFLACCVLFGLTACSEKPQEQPQIPTQTEVKQEQSQTVESKPVEEPNIYADEAKRLTLWRYITYDITQIVPYTSQEQIRLFNFAFGETIKEKQTLLNLKKCPSNSYYQTAHGIYLQSIGKYQEAYKYYEMASEKGNVYAENRLGELYLLGLGVERDVEKARYWFERSAKTGYYFAESALGVSYLDIPKQVLVRSDNKTAGLLFYNLNYSKVGKNADIEKARYWLIRAAMQGDRASRDILSNFNLNYQPIEIQENLVDIKIDSPVCSNTKDKPIVIIKENLPKRYKIKKDRPTNYMSRYLENDIFLGDKVVIRERNPNRISRQEFIEESNKVIVAE